MLNVTQIKSKLSLHALNTLSSVRSWRGPICRVYAPGHNTQWNARSMATCEKFDGSWFEVDASRYTRGFQPMRRGTSVRHKKYKRNDSHT